jgi:hypothetical protein
MNTATAQPMHRSVTAAADRRARMPCGWLSALACALLLAAGDGFAQGKPDATPPFLSESVAPNLVITVDDSTSMAFAYVPDTLPTTYGPTRIGRRNWYTSSEVNALYYNPDPAIEYEVPPSLPLPDFHDLSRYPFGAPAACEPRTINLDTEYKAVRLDYRVNSFGGCTVAFAPIP